MKMSFVVRERGAQPRGLDLRRLRRRGRLGISRRLPLCGARPVRRHRRLQLRVLLLAQPPLHREALLALRRARRALRGALRRRVDRRGELGGGARAGDDRGDGERRPGGVCGCGAQQCEVGVRVNGEGGG